jgi:hypothetical protein
VVWSATVRGGRGSQLRNELHRPGAVRLAAAVPSGRGSQHVVGHARYDLVHLAAATMAAGDRNNIANVRWSARSPLAGLQSLVAAADRGDRGSQRHSRWGLKRRDHRGGRRVMTAGDRNGRVVLDAKKLTGWRPQDLVAEDRNYWLPNVPADPPNCWRPPSAAAEDRNCHQCAISSSAASWRPPCAVAEDRNMLNEEAAHLGATLVGCHRQQIGSRRCIEPTQTDASMAAGSHCSQDRTTTAHICGSIRLVVAASDRGRGRPPVIGGRGSQLRPLLRMAPGDELGGRRPRRPGIATSRAALVRPSTRWRPPPWRPRIEMKRWRSSAELGSGSGGRLR